jgi:uncharacterized protein (DUF1501 family)
MRGTHAGKAMSHAFHMPTRRPTRRQLLAGSGALFAWAYAPRLAIAEGRDPRLLVVILRGALDGLAVAAPVGDPGWKDLRGDFGLRLNGQRPALALDSFFALNAAMPNLHRLYHSKQALIVHATATPYRERSHFDGQDVLESGLPRVGASETGWLNRALLALDPGHRVNPKGAFAVGPVTPLIARGSAPVIAWSPPRVMPTGDDTTMRLLDIYRHTDPALAEALENRRQLLTLAKAGGIEMAPGPQAGETVQAATPIGGLPPAVRAYFADTAAAAARFLAQSNGPRVGALAYNGWDTHINEGAMGGQLANLLGALDAAISGLETGMGAAWPETVVVVVTEFGRTAKLNGTFGTDHGTGTVALLAGGALRGGRVVADWPGVREAELHEGRDLKATTDLRAVLKGVLRDHLRVEEAELSRSIFPDSGQVLPLDGLVA